MGTCEGQQKIEDLVRKVLVLNEEVYETHCGLMAVTKQVEELDSEGIKKAYRETNQRVLNIKAVIEKSSLTGKEEKSLELKLQEIININRSSIYDMDRLIKQAL